MRKIYLLPVALFLCIISNAQLQVSKLIGKGSNDFNFGYGGFLMFSLPVSDAADLTLEAGAVLFQEKDYPGYGWAIIPIKAGYRYTFNQTGTGLYIEPQVGYNVYGIDPDDIKFNGLTLSGGFGYLFPHTRKIQLNVGLYFETAFHSGNRPKYISLRFTHNIALKRRESDY